MTSLATLKRDPSFKKQLLPYGLMKPERMGRKKFDVLAGFQVDFARKIYVWTDVKTAHLVLLGVEKPNHTPKQLAESLNEIFPEGRRATAKDVSGKLSKLHAQWPRHKKEPEPNEAVLASKLNPYVWTDEKTEYFIFLIGQENPGLTRPQLAQALNEKFPENPQATTQSVKGKLLRLYKKRSDLRKRPKPYVWTDEKTAYLTSLKNQDPNLGNGQLAQALNQRFPDGTQAKAKTIENKIMRLNKKIPDLK